MRRHKWHGRPVAVVDTCTYCGTDRCKTRRGTYIYRRPRGPWVSKVLPCVERNAPGAP